MKKATIIFVLLSVMLLSVVAVANASDTKEDYYLEITCSLSKIEYGLMHEDREGALEEMKNLRDIIYRTARYLAEIQEYDVRIMQVLTYANRAFTNEDVIKYITLARNTASQVLLGRIEDDIDACCTPESLHS